MATRIRFLLDEHIAHAVADGLRRRGIDALTAAGANRRSLPDEEQLAYAFEEGRVVVTMDDDYLALAAEGIAHAGICFLTNPHCPVGELVQLLTLVCDSFDAAEMMGQVEYL